MNKAFLSTLCLLASVCSIHAVPSPEYSFAPDAVSSSYAFAAFPGRMSAVPAMQADSAENGMAENSGELILPTGMLADTDSILREWHAENFLHYRTDCEQLPEDVEVPDSVYIERLSMLPNVIEMPYNAIVREYMDAYTKRGRKKVSVMLAAANFYLPIFEEALDLYGLPLELKYLPVIESALDPTAVSHAGAVGIWQFMITTGKLYGLESTSLIDDRRDPVKSSYAAAKYLNDLYRIFGDWTLAIAAYNCGPQNVNKAIHRAGGAKDFWTIYPYLPRETRGYVPAFIAANYVMNYYCEHGICPMEADLSFKSDTIGIDRRLHFNQIAGTCGVSLEVLRALNPQYKADLIPAGGNTLRLPMENVSQFIDLGDSVYNYMADVYQNVRSVAQVGSETAAVEEADKPQPQKTTTRPRTHTVRRGETLSTIAKRYRTTVRKLRALNGIKGSNIRAGRRLRVR